MKNYLVTGGAGFIGSNFLIHMANQYPDRKFINIDKLTYAGDLSHLEEINSYANYEFVQGDISDEQTVTDVFQKYRPQGVYNFAAESHVDNSISSPMEFINTNILGTFWLLEAAKKLWLDVNFDYRTDFIGARFLHVSTDEVYGTLGESGLFRETSAYAPNSPYSASKAGSDHIVRSYFHTYGMQVVTTNCSNNYGPKQHGEKLIPTIIRRALAGEPIPIYGDGTNIRDWLYVLDHCKGIDIAFEKGMAGETYNIGGRNERTNLEVVTTICKILETKKPKEDTYEKLITFVKDRPGHDKRYAIDARKIERELGWKADENFESGIDKTVGWYLEKYT